jgi:hypothetical protein
VHLNLKVICNGVTQINLFSRVFSMLSITLVVLFFFLEIKIKDNRENFRLTTDLRYIVTISAVNLSSIKLKDNPLVGKLYSLW